MTITGVIAQTEEAFNEYLQELTTVFDIEQIQADSANSILRFRRLIQ
jgi:hypothetical protein